MLPVTGSVSENIGSIGLRGRANLIYVAPTTATTTWSMSITNSDSIPIRQYTEHTGTNWDNNPLDLWGIHTVTITQLTGADENFTLFILIDQPIIT
jgi:hypothetical protein